MVELLRTKHVKTRKPHKCFACLEEFPAGTEMQVSTNVDDGHIYNLYICEKCEEFMNKHHDLCFDPFEQIYREGCVREARAERKEILKGGKNDV